MCKSSKVDSKAFCWRGYQTSENFFQALPNSRRSWVVELVIFCLDSARLHYRPSFFAGTGSLHGLAWQQWRRRRWFKKYQTDQCDQICHILTLWHYIFKALDEFWKSLFSIWENFEPTLAIFMLFIVVNGQILNKYWSSHLVTRPWTMQLRRVRHYFLKNSVEQMKLQFQIISHRLASSVSPSASVWPEKNCQMSIKVAQKWFH